MDQTNQTKLRKAPPSSFRSLTSPSSQSSLSRAPSAPTYPRNYFSNSGRERDQPQHHNRSRSSLHSSTSTSRQSPGPGNSPVLAHHGSGPLSSGGQYSHGSYSPNLRGSVIDKTSEELIGAPFDAPGILDRLDPTKATGFQNSQRRPGPPPLSHTAPNPQGLNLLRHSQSFHHGQRPMDVSPPQAAVENGRSAGISKRLSDDSGASKGVGGLKKKGGFSGFMNSMLGSPRNIKISAPENPVHVTHVGYDNDTGQFTVSRLL